jgi:predicted phosphodiesterase
MKIGVVSDLHANAPAVDAALSLLEREEAIDALVVLGDLLTYGCRPVEVIARLQRASTRWPTTFLVGNHDQLYFELQRGEHAYFDTVPKWIQESARATADALDAAHIQLADTFTWQREHVVGDTLFSHANPFGAGDWTYLNGDDARTRAVQVLHTRSMRMGVFGHTHRTLDDTRDTGPARVRLVNPGSLGQPRDGTARSTVGLWVDGDWRIMDVAYDVRAHLADVERSSLSTQTKREIVKYHAKNLATAGEAS